MQAWMCAVNTRTFDLSLSHINNNNNIVRCPFPCPLSYEHVYICLRPSTRCEMYHVSVYVYVVCWEMYGLQVWMLSSISKLIVVRTIIAIPNGKGVDKMPICIIDMIHLHSCWCYNHHSCSWQMAHILEIGHHQGIICVLYRLQTT